MDFPVLLRDERFNLDGSSFQSGSKFCIFVFKSWVYFCDNSGGCFPEGTYFNNENNRRVYRMFGNHYCCEKLTKKGLPK